MKQRPFIETSFGWSALTVLLAAATAGAVLAHAAEPGTSPLTLERAVALALQHNPGLRAASGRREAAAGRAQQAGRWTNPELELSAEDWPVGSGRGFPDAKQTVGVVQTLPFPGKKSTEHRIGAMGVRLSEAELALRRVELVRDVKAAFCQVLAAERLQQVATELVGVAQGSAAAARQRAEGGATPYQEQLRAEIQLEQARAELTGYQRELAGTRRSLATLLGEPNRESISIAGVLRETTRPELLAPGVDLCLAQHPSVAAARAHFERAELEARRAQLEPYPDVKVGVSGGRVGATGESIIELGFSVPLPILDRSKGRKQEAQANVTIAQAELAEVEQRLWGEWHRANQRYRAAIDQVGTYRDRIVPKATEALRLVQRGFEEGKFNFIDLADTQRTAAEVRLAYHQRLLELNIAQAELEAVLEPTVEPPQLTQ